MDSIVKKTLKISLAAGLIIGGLYLSFRLFSGLEELKTLNQKKAAWTQLKNKVGQDLGRFNGEAAIVIKDLNFNWGLAYREDKLFPAASLAKIPLMCAVFLASSEGRLKLEQPVILRNRDKLAGSGILKDVRPGTFFTVEKLIGLMIYDSDNTATNILTDLLGLDYSNRAFLALGLKDTRLLRRIADYRLRDRGVENYTSARDIACLLEMIYRRRLINRMISEQCLRILKLQRVNDRIPRDLPAEVTVAHKTGLERNVCHDAGIIFSPRGNLLVCVLTWHTNPNAAGAKDFIAQVAKDVYDYAVGADF